VTLEKCGRTTAADWITRRWRRCDCERSNRREEQRLLGIGVALGGHIYRGKVIFSTLAGWIPDAKGFDLALEISQHLALPQNRTPLRSSVASVRSCSTFRGLSVRGLPPRRPGAICCLCVEPHTISWAAESGSLGVASPAAVALLKLFLYRVRQRNRR